VDEATLKEICRACDAGNIRFVVDALQLPKPKGKKTARKPMRARAKAKANVATVTVSEAQMNKLMKDASTMRSEITKLKKESVEFAKVKKNLADLRAIKSDAKNLADATLVGNVRDGLAGIQQTVNAQLQSADGGKHILLLGRFMEPLTKLDPELASKVKRGMDKAVMDALEAAKVKEFTPGVKVYLGPDAPDRDSFAGSIGVIAEHQTEVGWATVAWKTGAQSQCRVGADNAYDLLVANPRVSANELQQILGQNPCISADIFSVLKSRALLEKSLAREDSEPMQSTGWFSCTPTQSQNNPDMVRVQAERAPAP
jgi:hypothetical protein